MFINLVGIRYKNELGDLIDAEVFEGTFVHFGRKDKGQYRIASVGFDFSCYSLGRIVVVSLIRSKLSGLYQVDLTKLDTEKKQLRALEVLFYNCYFNNRGIFAIDSYAKSFSFSGSSNLYATKRKTAIQDLDPVKNERDFMDLCYRLEHEVY